MALLYCDSFAHFDNAHILAKWTQFRSVDGPSTLYGRGGRFGVNMNAGSTNQLSKTLPARDNIVVGAYAFINGVQGGVLYQAQVPDGYLTLATVCQLRVLPDGTVAAVSGNTSDLIANPKSLVLPQRVPFYWEVKINTVLSAGKILPTMVVRINGQQIISGTGAAGHATNLAGDAKFDYHTFGACGFPGSYLGDLYVCDQTGLRNNDFLGDVKVGAIFPRLDSSSMQWTPSSGVTGFNRINAHIPPDDASYIQTNTPTQLAEFFFDTIASFSGEILGFQYSLYSRKTDEGTRIVNHTAGLGAFKGPDQYLGDGYFYRHLPFDYEPVSGLPPTPALINAQTFGALLKS